MTTASQSTMERILRLMASKNASDVYLSAHAPVTIRINGQCVTVNRQPLGPEAPLNLLAEILPESRIEELRQTGELNLAHTLSDVGNYRISAMRQRGTYAVVIRYISPTIPAFDTLHVPAVLKELIMHKRGLILMVGATGTGKSTTLASILDHRNAKASGHILTIENPIEYQFTNKRSIVNQREVGTDTKDLQTALMNALRQAPDVIMIGEIRDRETMTAAIAYAQSGHLCLATLHANNSYHALNRILSFYPVEVRPTLLGDLAASLRAIVSQRLIPVIAGGRLPAVEVLLNTKLVSELIEKSDFTGVKEAMDNALAAGSQTFEGELARMINEGIIERDVGLSFSDSPTNLLWRLQNSGRDAFGEEKSDTDSHGDGSAASFTEIKLDVQTQTGPMSTRHSGFSESRSGGSGFYHSTMGGYDDSRIGDA